MLRLPNYKFRIVSIGIANAAQQLLYTRIPKFAELQDFFVDQVFQLLDVGFLGGGDEYGGHIIFPHPGVFEVLEGEIFFENRGEVVILLYHMGILIDLVEKHDHRFIGSVDICEGLIYYCDLVFKGGMRDVGNVDQQIGFADFIECGFKGFNKSMGKFTDESDGIRQ
jgi:hypothetical protein